jgi:protein-tyrosine phosphatase
MVDIHCHILPQVDDGPASWEVSLEMCRMAVADGIRHIVATPHANDRYPYDREYYSSLLSRLGEMLQDDTLAFSLGCDFHLSYENLQDAFAHPDRYVIGNTGYLLVEFSNFSIPPQTSEFFWRFLGDGITPILTHPERNPILQRELERVLQWVEKGCLVQLTANALTGRWGPRASKAATWLLDKHAVHVIATDAHNLDNRPPVLSAARDLVAEEYGPEIASSLVEGNPEAVIAGRPLPYLPAVRASRTVSRD